MDNTLRQLGTNREIFTMLSRDAACYTFFAGKALQELYPSLMHITCIAHLLELDICAMRVRADFNSVNEVVATIIYISKNARKFGTRLSVLQEF